MVTMGIFRLMAVSRSRISSAEPLSTTLPTSTAPAAGSSVTRAVTLSSIQPVSAVWYTISDQPARRAASSAPAHMDA